MMTASGPRAKAYRGHFSASDFNCDMLIRPDSLRRAAAGRLRHPGRPITLAGSQRAGVPREAVQAWRPHADLWAYRSGVRDSGQPTHFPQ